LRVKIIFLFIFLFLVSCSKNKKETINSKSKDSLEVYIKQSIDDNANKISSTNKALSIIKTINNDSVNRKKLLDISIDAYRNNNKLIFNNSAKKLIEISIEAKDSSILGQIYRYKGNFFKSNEINYDSSFIYYLKAEKFFRKLKDIDNLSSIYLNKSVVQYNIGDYVGADRTLTQTYKISKILNNDNKLYVTYTMMGIVSNELNDYDKSIDYYTRALKIVEKNKLFENFEKETCINNIGYVYQKKGSYFEAIKNYNLALSNTSIKDNAKELYSLLIDNLAYCKFKTNNQKDLPTLFYKSLLIREKLNNNTLIILSKIHLSEYFYENGNTIKSKLFANEALSLSKENGVSRDFLAALKQASIVDNENSVKYSNEYVKISDSIRDVERLSQEKFSRLQLETDEIIQEKDQLEDKNRNLLYFFFGSVGLFGFLYYLRTQRAKNRELIYKQAQQRANEEIFNLMMSQQAIIDESRTQEKQKLARDLHDGVLGRMFGLRLSLDSVNRKNDEASLLKRLQIIDELKTIEQDIREISHDLNREKQVLINNFVSIVNNLIEEQKEKHHAKVSFFLDTSIHWDKIASAVKINLYRILQESLQNINKYANAKNINIGFVKNEDTIIFKISDDGIGFDANKKTKGIGTQNMVARTKECKGTIDIQSEIGEGTTITITIPTENK
jgi:signal transduction histidine kinase